VTLIAPKGIIQRKARKAKKQKKKKKQKKTPPLPTKIQNKINGRAPSNEKVYCGRTESPRWSRFSPRSAPSSQLQMYVSGTRRRDGRCSMADD
jgi:hypothetical protein